MKNTIGQIILNHLEKQNPGKTEFSLREIIKATEEPKLLEHLQSISDADHPYFQDNYLAAIFHNYTKRQNPKITRRLNNNLWHYKLNK